MARTWALIAPVEPILHRVSCSNERLPNAPKHYETHKNKSLGSNWVYGCIHCENFQWDFMPRTCALILPFRPTLHRVLCINERIQNAPKHYQMHQNMSLRSNGWIGFVCGQKFWCDFMARTFALITPVQLVLLRVSCSNETLPNAPKHYEADQNMSLGSNGVDWVRSLQKNSHATSWHELLH